MNGEERHGELKRQLAQVVDDLDLAPAAPEPFEAEEGGPRRGTLRSPAPEPATVLSVVEQDGVLLVDEGLPAISFGGLRRRGPRTLGLGAEVVEERSLKKLERNEIGEALEKLDRKLTPNQGLRELRDGELVPCPKVVDEGRVFLLVHGTFSNNDHLWEQIRERPEFVSWLGERYAQVLAWDHPTLAVSPMVNARELALAVGGSAAAIDVVTHSRGGLVTRWWLEAFDRGAPESRRAVFVGSPLAGTGLAAPPNLKSSLSLLMNLGRALGAAAAAVPFLSVVAGIFRVVTSVVSLAAKTPAIDAAVALVPGLAAQSRVGNNFELLSLRERAGETAGRYFAVQADFESEAPGWQFWKVFRNLPQRGADLLVDTVFDGPNDLVVDSSSMASFTDRLRLPRDQVLDFGTQSEVHHVSYFRHKETLDWIAEKLG